MRTHQQVLADHDTMGSVALAVMVDLYGAEMVEWEPETVEMEIRGMGVHAPVAMLNKLNAAMSVMASDMFFRDFPSWNMICGSLTHGNPDPDRLVPVDLDTASWGCLETMLLLGPEEYNGQDFEHNIREHVGRLLMNEGLYTAPRQLFFARIDPAEAERTSIALASDPVLMAAKSERDADHLAELDGIMADRMTLLRTQMMTIDFHHVTQDFLKTLK